ncbi:BEN domain-containing protein 5-like [Dermacentor albipictus]|uniref:BEN domain-containing protein 5-like n=2 Tax=Dermacentor albipictus TaxID=60249 RepID=UPI0031FDCA11
MSAPTHAYVEYEDGGKAIVSVSLIKDYSPNDFNDLACNKRIYWRDRGKGFEGEEGYYSGNVMVLGCGKADLIARMLKQHKPVPMDVFEQSSERHRHKPKPALKDVPTKEKRRRLESAKKSRMQKILEKKSAAGDTDSSSEDELVPRKMLKKAENEIAGLKNKLRICEQQRIEERQQNEKRHSLLEERMNSMEASIIEAIRKEVRAARLPSQGCAANVCSDNLQQAVREAPMKPCEDNSIQEESTTLYEDLDLGTAPMDGALPAHCESAKPSCVLGPREEVAGSQVASHVPSTHGPVPVPAELGVEAPLFTPVGGKVHIGNGLFICANKWTWVNQAKTDSTFAREVARCLWQPHELVGRSVTGKVCMSKLKEGGEAKPALTPEKLGAVRKSYEHFVANHPSTVDTEARRLKDLNKHLATMLRDAK